MQTHVRVLSVGGFMGLGPTVLAMYRQMKTLGLFEGISDVVELGSQGVWCPEGRMLKELFNDFGRPVPPEAELAPYINSTGTGIAPSRHLHEALGFHYDCVDIDGNFGSLTLDINFDSVPEESRGRYGLTTNHGTTEHLLNQYNAFKMIHDFTKPGGLILHALPFTVHLEHGFFNYQPNFFEALARYNSYENLGIWVGPDWTLASFIPWQPQLLEYLTLNAKTTHLLVVLQRKMFDTEFCVPIQNHYENMVPEHAASRYCMVVDGEYYDGRRFRHLTKEGIIADAISKEVTPLRNIVLSLDGQLSNTRNELGITQYEMGKLKEELARRDAQVADREALLAQQAALTAERDAAIAERNAALAERKDLSDHYGRDVAAELGRRVMRRLHLV